MLQSESDIGTTQIDHVIVSNFGIFCIETKSHSGWILGRKNDKYWTQSINYKKYRFYNPLRQNYGHVKSLEQILTLLNISIPIYSFIVFPFAEELKITGTDTVGHIRGIINKIKDYDKAILTNEDRDKIVNTINQVKIVDKSAHKDHSGKIREMRTAPPPVRSKNKYKHKRKYKKYDNFFDSGEGFDF